MVEFVGMLVLLACREAAVQCRGGVSRGLQGPYPLPLALATSLPPPPPALSAAAAVASRPQSVLEAVASRLSPDAVGGHAEDKLAAEASDDT